MRPPWGLPRGAAPWSHAAIGFLVGSAGKLTSFEFEYSGLELGIGVFELVGPPAEVLLEFEVFVSELSDHSFHIQDAAVSDLVARISHGWRISRVPTNDGDVSTAAFGVLGVSAASGHDEQELG